MKNRSSFYRTGISLLSLFAFVVVAMLFSNCRESNKKANSNLGLKDYYTDYFPVGVAVTPQNLEGETGEMIKKNFNSLTAENVMKPALIHPEENRYDWESADKIVDFAVANNMKVRGHTLCWHAQTGEWMFKDSLGNQVSKEVGLARLKEHITQVVSRYKGKVYAWDVLNEAIDDDPDTSKIFRESPWYKLCGEEFIPKIYQWAHEADPDAVLFYNDYDTENPVKREKVYKMLKKFLAAGVPIHAVGLQAHWNIDNPNEQEIRESIDKFSSLGLKVQITELDITIYTSKADTLNMGFTPEREQKQIDLYKKAFNVFREKKEQITGVTFWNISDGRSWLDRRNKPCYPLLFNQDLTPKKAYWEVVNF